jgi:hypothetical protein
MIRIQDFTSKATLKAAVALSVFLLFAAAAFGQSVNLTVASTTATMPDGTVVPMWGYFCGTTVSGSTATCAAANPNSPSGPTAVWAASTAYTVGQTILDSNGNVEMVTGAGMSGAAAPTWATTAGTTTSDPTPAVTGGVTWTNMGSLASYLATSGSWSPVVITVPTGAPATPASLLINLSNLLSFTPAGSTPNNIPTSIVIVGQVGGGLGKAPTTTPPPDHEFAQGCTTWFIASGSTPPGTPCTQAATSNPGSVGGTNPTTASTTPPVQGPRIQSMGTEVAGGATAQLSWAALKPGTYLLESGTHPSIQVPMGLIGVLVVTAAPTSAGTVAGTAYPGVACVPVAPATTCSNSVPAVQYNAELPLEFSEIDPVQNKAVAAAVATAGFSETAVWTQMNNGASLSALTVTNGGSGYSAPASVNITGGGGSGAAATATLSYGVATASVTSGGMGYAVGDTISLTGGGGTGAVATVATITGTGTGPVATVTVTNNGSGYTSAPTTDTTITGSGSGATLAATLATTGSVATVTITNVGIGYTSAPTVTVTGGAGTGAVVTVSTSTGNASCGAAHTCYPPAVNYTPFYYLINGVALDKTNATRSVFAATSGVSTTGSPVTTGIAGTVLLRLVNAGLRMHTPSIVGSLTGGFDGFGKPATVGGFTLIAEDGNVLPNVAVAGNTTVPAAPRVQTDVLMVPSKVFDAFVNVPALPTGSTSTPALPIYARDLALSGNSSERDAGMVAYISVNNTNLAAALPTGNASLFAGAFAQDDKYPALAPGQPFAISDPSKGVIANDTNVYGVALNAAKPPANGTLSCPLPGSPTTGNAICANGTFTYTPNSATTASDSFGYCANGTTTICATVTLSQSSLTNGYPTAVNQTYNGSMASYIKIDSPGLLLGNTDPNGLPISIAGSSLTACPAIIIATCGVVDPKGGFTLAIPPASAGSIQSFTYTVKNSQGTLSTGVGSGGGTGTVMVTFPAPSLLKVSVLDAQLYNSCNGDSSCLSGVAPLTDYRWIIEEDETFYVDPNCTTNQSITTAGCPAIVGPAGQSTIPTYGTNFHTSAMNFVAQGCTGPNSCEFGQTMLDTGQACTSPGVPTGCSPTAGTHIPAVCDLGNGACRPDPGDGTHSGGSTWVDPGQVHLDPTKRYYISVLPGDAANPFPANVNAPTCPPGGGNAPDSGCGHTMGGASIAPACNFLLAGCTPASTASFSPVNVLVVPTPMPTGRLSVIVFEDDYPLNGEQDGGGGNGTVAPIEPGLGGFNIVLWDTFGGLGDVTGQDSNDAFNQPLSNGLAGTIDPSTGIDACPISLTPLSSLSVNGGPTGSGLPNQTPQGGMTGMIVTCPTYEADNQTLSPLAGQAVIYNLMPDKFSVQAYPGADRIARGEQWLQTNTLDGQHPHDSFIRVGEPGYFQEYGPAGYHVAIGFANPAIINARHNDVCNGNGTPGTVGPCTNTITGQINVERLSRTPDQRLYPSGSHDALTWTQCWVSLGDPDGEDFMFTMCDANGNFKFASVPGGNWRLTVGDQWNDQIIDGLSIPGNVGCTSQRPNLPTNATTCPGGQTLNLPNIGVQQWQSNLYTHVFIDDNKNGIPDKGEIGIPFLYTRIYYRDGHNSNGLSTDFNGIANFNETFPLFNWYVVEADSTRYKRTGIHTVYDAGGPADGSGSCLGSARPCGTSGAYNFLSNTFESVPLPADLSVPGAVYCKLADCGAEANASFANATPVPSFGTASTGRIDPPWVNSEGWAGLTSHGNWIDFGFAPYAVGETGGIHGQVTYASTRPFDTADQMILQPWEPLVPNVTINLYQEGFAPDGVTPTLTMVDTTKTSSWDTWAQGFYPGATAGTGASFPYMNCPGQGTNVGTNADLFYFTLFDQPNYLDYYNSVHNGGTLHTLPYNSQFKCYDAMHVGNQIQPAPYDGEFFFPSTLGINPTTGAITGTNCKICVVNPDTSDKFRAPTTPSTAGTLWTPTLGGAPMLPAGKYVVEVVMPPGYEVYKEEDKNLLIGDNFIAPVTQQFGGLGGYIFIIPDQASVASMYDQTGSGYNPNNYQDQTTSFGLSDRLSGVPGYPGFQDPVWPCVGEQRVVPDFLSLFPNVQEVAPFAGATRPLCDRKEVTLGNQMNVRMHFAVFTSTHIAAKFTGGITDDFTSEFDPFAPQFGEKFAPPNMPVSTRDYFGNEITRVYTDHWGQYNGLTFSSWEVNPPNITGYSPSMMTQCMNDPGPILDKNPSSPTYGKMITDPLYNPAYSDFCYELPYMPGLTTYTDTPVVPTQAFVGAGYNNVDCAYPDATPAVKEVDGDGIGPWVSQAGNTLTITALGDQQVNNSAYSGPSANAAPFNSKTVGRHYGFGTQCTSVGTNCSAVSSVTIGGVNAIITNWSDSAIIATVPGPTTSCTTASSTCNPTPVPACAVQQQSTYQNLPSPLPSNQSATALCGQLLITAGNGKQSIDSVTVTVAGKTPTHVSASQTVQGAIDAAYPGDMIIVDPTCTTSTSATTGSACVGTIQSKAIAAHSEMVIMWKPVRLQGVGAASSIITANAQPAGKLLDPWRRHINCLFGLTLQGVPVGSTSSSGGAPAVYDSTGNYNCPDNGWNMGSWSGATNNPQIDRLPLEATVGWDATLNGNLAEQLQEPSLMGAFEGAGVTVLAKGVDFHGANPWGNEAAFPAGTTILTGVGSDPTQLATGDANPLCNDGTGGANRFPSNFQCNPSSIDGMGIINSSQGGGGIFAHGWAHHLQIANNRVYNNAGTLTGGISVGQGEFPDPVVAGAGPTATNLPGSCMTDDGTHFVAGQHLPYCLQIMVNVHNNYITNNSSLGDELFSGTLSGGGGATFCTGNDYYKFNYNWVCGNLSSGEGGGIVHLGEIQNGDIEHNSIVLNQSQNPTIPTNGGGIHIQGTPDIDPICGVLSDADCPTGLSDGTGHNLVINANLIQGNMAESGAGGGIRLQSVNGSEVSTFPTQPNLWNDVSITNNIIVNNVAGWDGAGISLQDALNAKIVNNTIANNDSLASSGVLTQSIGTPMASAPPGECHQAGPSGPTSASCPQSAGLTSTPNSSVLTTTFTGLTLTCPGGLPHCSGYSNPVLYNNVFWQNRSFYIGITGPGAAPQDQQNLVALFPAFTSTAVPPQTFVGECAAFPSGSVWDIGVRGDTGPTNHGSGLTLQPVYSLLSTTNAAYNTGTNFFGDPAVAAQYCNGSRVPPTCTVADGCGGPSGYGVPPGIVDASAPNPVFSLTPDATVDEGNNWINVSWGPLALSDDSVTGGANGNYGGGPALGNYVPQSFSPTIDKIPCSGSTAGGCVEIPGGTLPQITAPATDFFGNPRPNVDPDGLADIGAVEFQGNAIARPAPHLNAITPNIGTRSSVVQVLLTGTNLDGAVITVTPNTGIAVSGTDATATTVAATFTIGAGAPLTARSVTVFTPAPGGGTSNAVTFTVVGPTISSFTPNPMLRSSTTIPVTITGVDLLGATAVNVSGTGIACNGVASSGTLASSTVTANCTTSLTAATGARNVTVVTPGGTTPAFAITVQPTVSGFTPTTGQHGATVPLVISGAGLAGATGVTMSGAGVNCTGVTATATTVNASCAIGATAGLTARTVTVVDATNGNINAPGTFQITGATLTISAPAPVLTTTPANTTTKSGTITVTNTATGAGATAFTFTAAPAITKVGTAGGTFSITGGTCASGTVLNPGTTGNTCTIIVQYAPGTSTATSTANVTVTGTGLGTPSQTGANFTAN